MRSLDRQSLRISLGCLGAPGKGDLPLLWFSILARKVLKRGSFTSVEDLKAKVLAFIAYYNRTMAKPFRWNYGKPLRT
jgi:hypothetical protein